MKKRNNGFTEQDKLQNEFTAFITVSFERTKLKYIKREAYRLRLIGEMEDEKFALIPDGTDFVETFCENEALAYALKQLDERERYVLVARVLQGKTFDEIAEKLGIKYKGVAAIYYRTTAKLRNILGGM